MAGVSRDVVAERRIVIRWMFEADKTDEEISQVVGLVPGTVKNVRGFMGLHRKHPGNIASLIPGAHGPQLDYEYIQQEYSGPDSIPVIARALGAHPDSVRRILRDSLHLIDKREYAPVAPEVWARADSMLDGTITYAEVAKTVGLTRNQVAWKFPNRGLKQENMGAYRSAVQLAEGLGI